MDAERSNDHQVLDPAALDTLRELQEDGEPDILGELVAMFETDSEERLQALQQAVREGRPADVTKAAHSLTGGSAVFGAESVVTVCRELQSVGGSGDLSAAPDLVDRLLAEYERLRTALRHEVARGE